MRMKNLIKNILTSLLIIGLAFVLSIFFQKLDVQEHITTIFVFAMMGVGAARRMSNVNWSVVKEQVFTWVFTFPGCGLLGFGVAKLFLIIFA